MRYCQYKGILCEFATEYGYCQVTACVKRLPYPQPTYADEEIQKMQDLEQAQIEKAYQLGYEEGKKDAEPERKTGRWIDGSIPTYAACSECGYQERYADENNYCPNCWARMKP